MDLSLLIGDYSPLAVVAFLVGSTLFAAIAVIATNRFGPYATMAIVTLAVLGAAIDASREWLDELPNFHVGNPDLTRLADWVKHLQTSGVAFLIPALAVTGLALALRRQRGSLAAKIAVVGLAAMVGIALGVSAREILLDVMYQ